jgi:hypothetical protein
MQAIIGKLTQKAIQSGMRFSMRYLDDGYWEAAIEPEFSGDDDEKGALAEDKDLARALDKLEKRLGEAGWQ